MLLIAWTAEDGTELDGTYHRPDGVNWMPCLRTVTQAHALMWCNEEQPGDRERAEKHAAEHDSGTARVLEYPADEPDPLGRARREVMEVGR